MCVVSNVTDWGWNKWPLDPVPSSPYVPTLAPYTGPSKAEWEEFKDLIKKAIEIDIKTGQPDCVDPKKQEWMDKMSKIYDEMYGS